jgi:hypothetical protein
MLITTKQLLLTALTTLCLLIVGCEQDQNQSEPAAPMNASNWDRALAEPARLIDVLPATTLAYVRIPTLWGLVTAPKSSALASALGSEANRETVMALQARIPELLEEELDEFAPLLSLLLAELRSPLEVALVGDGPQPLEADLVIEARLALDSVEEVNALFSQYASPSSPFQQLQAADEGQPGQLLLGLFPMFYDFDADSQRLRLVGGMAANIEDFEAARTWSASSETALKQREQAIDDSGQGLMVWADGTRLMPALEQMADPQAVAQLRELGLLGLSEFALAYGSQDGKARFSLVARGSDGALWDMAPPGGAPSSVPISADADYIAGLSVPDYAWVDALWRRLDPNAEDEMAAIDAELEELTGLRLADFIDALAGRWMLVSDQSGGWAVQEPSAPAAWPKLLEGLSARFDLTQREVEHEGQTLRHLTIPGLSMPDMLPVADSPGERTARFLAERTMAIGSHIHWMEDGEGRRILAAVPQVLRDRLTLSGEQTAADWLANKGLTATSAFGAIEVANAPRRNYYTYLALLQGLGDIFDTPIDLHAFPSAHELGLATRGGIGFEATWADGTVGLGLVFENHPGELLYSGAGGFGGVAMVAILAAIAIPAYQDYVDRAAASEFLAYAAPLQSAISEFYAREGRLPSAEEAASFSQRFDSGPVARIDYNARLLRLIMTLSAEAGFGADAEVELVPVIQNGEIAFWRCSAPGIDDPSTLDPCMQ